MPLRVAADDSATELPVSRAAKLKKGRIEDRWLVKDLWARSAVGILGGAPKCYKSWIGLDLAVSVASGTPCLGKLHVDHQGPALIYMAEDSTEEVQARLAGLCRQRKVDLASLPLDVITAPTLRLDLERDQERLAATVRRLKPRFLLLDPFVRLHRIDENSSSAVGAVLGYLRGLQREHGMAIMLTHHARKNSAAGVRGGQGLRGSGDLHAWGDSNLYVKRSGKTLTLSIEHRAAPEPEPLTLELVGGDDAHLEITGQGAPETGSQAVNEKDVRGAILSALAEGPRPGRVLRQAAGVRHDRAKEALASLESEGRVRREGDRWVLAA